MVTTLDPLDPTPTLREASRALKRRPSCAKLVATHPNQTLQKQPSVCILVALTFLMMILIEPIICVPPAMLRATPMQVNETSFLHFEPQQRPLSSQIRQRRFLNFDKQPLVDKNPLPMLYIGAVRLDEYPQCQSWLEPYLNKCQRQYEVLLQSHIARRYQKYQLTVQKLTESAVREGRPVKPVKPFSYDRNAEYIKHVSCCGMWQARNCVIDAIESDQNGPYRERVCPRDLIKRFRQLPDDPEIRADVFDYCSEYGDGTLICYHATSAALRPSHPLSSAAASIALVLLAIILPHLW